MGAASNVMRNEEEPATEPSKKTPEKEQNGIVAKKRNKDNVIFDSGEQNYDDSNLDELTGNDKMTPEQRLWLVGVFSGFFFFESKDEESTKQNISLMLRGMKKEEVTADTPIIVEGESGTKLFVVEEGTLNVTINGDHIRDMGRGAIVGELSLLYDAPRSATVRCQTTCVLWTLSREIFKKIQYISANATQVQRAKWMVAAPELAKLTAIDLSKLIGTLQVISFKAGSQLVTEGKPTNLVLVIEKGRASITSSTITGISKVDEIDKLLSIVRPKSDSPDSSDLFEGCILGLPVLKGKAGMVDGWQWVTKGKVSGSISPLSVTAEMDVDVIAFSAEVFETLLGSIEKVLSPGSPKETKQLQELKFDSTRFKQIHVLGAGSFGTVTYAKYTANRTESPTLTGEYALKSLSKTSIIETGQLRHVMDERLILSQMDSKFILKLWGTYTTPHTIVMVTEVVHGGDLWAVIYETPPFYRDRGIPHKLTAFYGACLTLALSHIHKKGIVFRDLKPENVMLDANGYLKLIDFGFAKKVPFMKKDANGEMKVFAKSYTLCGTPEYLSPELIFNLGHNQSADIWALGVMIYEMLMTITPFAPRRPDNITELFTNIAMVKKNGLVLSPKMNDHTKTPHSADIIMQLLKADPAERLGVQQGSTRCILDHPFFTTAISEETIISGEEKPSFLPNVKRKYDPISTIPLVRAFHGDQNLFSFF